MSEVPLVPFSQNLLPDAVASEALESRVDNIINHIVVRKNEPDRCFLALEAYPRSFEKHTATCIQHHRDRGDEGRVNDSIPIGLNQLFFLFATQKQE